MKKTLLSLALMAGLSASAQLPSGSIAPDFTLTDINNNTHNLYTYLDQGYSVVIDVSATWCGPCWNYHNTNALEDLWAAHGPSGGPGVAGNTTNDVIVIFVEGDGSTNSADLNGTGSNTAGDWVTGVYHPICDPATAAANAFNNSYQIAYFPTIYMICPNRIITEVGQQSAANLYAAVGNCPAPATDPADAALLSFDSSTDFCGGDYTPVVSIQNYGTSPMTSASVSISSNGSVVSTGTYSGSLNTYGIAQVTCSTISNFTNGDLVITVTTSGDNNAANGTMTKAVGATPGNGVNFVVEIVTDRYASETTWDLKDEGGTVIASGGPWSDLSASGTTVQTPVNVTLASNTCHIFTIYDSYGDGIDSGYGVGSYTVKDEAGNVVVTGGDFTSEESGSFKSGFGVNINENDELLVTMSPNPASSVVNFNFGSQGVDYAVTILDITGRIVYSLPSNAKEQLLTLSVEEFTAGTYMVIMNGSNGASKVERLVVR